VKGTLLEVGNGGAVTIGEKAWNVPAVALRYRPTILDLTLEVAVQNWTVCCEA
jgi:hypothetical protein